MPSTERELAFVFLEHYRARNVPTVVLVGNDAGKSIAEVLGEQTKQTPTVAEFELWAKTTPTEVVDGVIVNNELLGFVADPKKLAYFMQAALTVVRPGGLLVIRQDLSTVAERNTVAKLTNFFDVYRWTAEESATVTRGFDFYAVKAVESSIHAQQNWLDFVWILRRKDFPLTSVVDDSVTFREFLDTTQYTDGGIGAYEWIFGEGFISPGGGAENLSLLRRLNAKPGQHLLDIGGGIGGNAHQAAKEYGLLVTGIDLSANMLSIALDRAHATKDTRIRYLNTDVLKYEFPQETFDIAYSRDCIQHIDDMKALFDRIYKWLKPGGKVLITSYAKGKGEFSPEFAEYVNQRRYNLLSLQDYVQVAEQSNFVDVNVEDLTPRFKEIMLTEIDNAEKNKEAFLKKFPEKKYKDLLVGWRAKLGYIDADNHCWALIECTKPW